MKRLLFDQTVCVSEKKQDNPCLQCLRDVKQQDISEYQSFTDSFKIIKNLSKTALKKCNGFIQK